METANIQKPFDRIIRNSPITHMHRIHCWAVASSMFDKNMRVDHSYLIGESSAGVGVIGRSNIVIRDNSRSKSTVKKLPLLESWDSDYCLPKGESGIFSPMGLDGKSGTVIRWLGSRFDRQIFNDMKRGCMVASESLKDFLPPMGTKLHVLGCNGIPSHLMSEFLKEGAVATMQGKASFMCSDGSENKDAEQAFLFQQVMWHVYGFSYICFSPSSRQEMESLKDMQTKSRMMLNFLHDLKIKTKGETANE